MTKPQTDLLYRCRGTRGVMLEMLSIPCRRLATRMVKKGLLIRNDSCGHVTYMVSDEGERLLVAAHFGLEAKGVARG